MNELFNLSEQQLTNVTHVLFGNQKQANVINKAVVKIVARGLLDVSNSSCLDSEESVIKAATDYLQSLCDNGFSGSEHFVMLLAGEQSLACLKETGPKMVHVNQPNPESPKYTFRVGMLGEEPDVDNSAELSDTSTGTGILGSSTSASFAECPYEPTDDFATRARKIKDAILPLCPGVVKTEIPNDEYAQALCMAEYYYKNIYTGENNSKPVKPVVSSDTVKKVCNAWAGGNTINSITKLVNLDSSTIKEILNDNGYTVY